MSCGKLPECNFCRVSFLTTKHFLTDCWAVAKPTGITKWSSGTSERSMFSCSSNWLLVDNGSKVANESQYILFSQWIVHCENENFWPVYHIEWDSWNHFEDPNQTFMTVIKNNLDVENWGWKCKMHLNLNCNN